MLFIIYIAFLSIVNASFKHVFIEEDDIYKYTICRYSNHLNRVLNDLPNSFEKVLSENNSEKVSFYLECGYNPNTPLSTGNIPLFYPISLSNYRLCQKMLYHRINPNAQDSSGRSALHYAVAICNEPIIELLLNYGANPHLKDESDESPIDVAIKKDLKQIIRLLNSKTPKKNHCIIL